MNPRMKQPAMIIPSAMTHLQQLGEAPVSTGVPRTTLEMVNVRASQINGCGLCLDIHTRALRAAGESDERISCLAAWREVPYYDDAERAALALTEAVTRLNDQSDPVPDDVWQVAAEHYDEAALAGLLVTIATINAWNRLNVASRQVGGAWVTSLLRSA